MTYNNTKASSQPTAEAHYTEIRERALSTFTILNGEVYTGLPVGCEPQKEGKVLAVVHIGPERYVHLRLLPDRFNAFLKALRARQDANPVQCVDLSRDAGSRWQLRMQQTTETPSTDRCLVLVTWDNVQGGYFSPEIVDYMIEADKVQPVFNREAGYTKALYAKEMNEGREACNHALLVIPKGVAVRVKHEKGEVQYRFNGTDLEAIPLPEKPKKPVKSAFVPTPTSGLGGLRRRSLMN